MNKLAALLLLVAALWLLPHGQARADSIEQAYAKCQAELANMTAANGYSVDAACAQKPPQAGGVLGAFQTTFHQWGSGPNQATYWAFYSACTGSDVFNRTSGHCEPPPKCPSMALNAAPAVVGNIGQDSCVSNTVGGVTTSCEVIGSQDANGVPAWYNVGNECDPNTFTCPDGYYKDTNGSCTQKPDCPDDQPFDLDTGMCTSPNKCPAGQKRDMGSNACIPDPDSHCAAGSVKGPDGKCTNDPSACGSGKVMGSDGSCKIDANGDGVPDDQTGDHKATDSANCGQPPLCSGDEIMCLHAKQLWRVECNTRRNAHVDLDQYCKRPPVCERVALGDDNRTNGCTEQEAAGLWLQWRNLCETQQTNEFLKEIAGHQGGSAGDVKGDNNGDGVPDWWQNPGTGQLQGDDATNGHGSAEGAGVSSSRTVGADGLDQSGMGFGSTCPAPPTATVFGKTITMDPNGILCSWIALGGQFVLVLAALASLKIIGGAT